ncbi:hypothetical protein ATE68_22000 [Sphingopyxis sp. H038]|uniref:DUF5983 family protein n=1 Tax=unclassified Sphingopyxis TaxID=2614943 RepID=UPI000730F191|nr:MULTISPECIES: hypothetical protein [unclassified Sphingopyxis]KTE02882.1 hypothetical protein ATE78_06025 [Sphingopyxis sp. H012]KTE10264.1 hypothetical protein ATE70_10275 [Sphingopyxis sp. H053]KTE23226.1 hypothetical protein ATE75_19740 [Sphingopyxis sp. H080]KTE31340.1 hypothetical protein ATE68_22000 [Sphingopyxis sp. H038]KTE37679.1 hypothetical protein ATE73_21360 [Sphingopyxis sp. H077]
MIEPMLVLSTGNLTFETCNVWMKQTDHAVFEKADYGWFVYVAEPDDDELPADLSTCMAFARRRRCMWIMFDRDAPASDELPSYEW